MIYLANRLTIPNVEDWLASSVGTFNTNPKNLFKNQKPTGFVDRQYADGSFGRGCVMYANYISKGVRPDEWVEGLDLDGVIDGDTLTLVVRAASGWDGSLCFDYERHSINMGMAVNYPRVNEWPEWYTVTAGTNYDVSEDGGAPAVKTGAELIAGYDVTVGAGEELVIVVEPS
jgi:hypothetical protein